MPEFSACCNVCVAGKSKSRLTVKLSVLLSTVFINVILAATVKRLVTDWLLLIAEVETSYLLI
ncbi:MAG TPA: hypothetical protein VEV62_05605 [Parafilimonas sp.]|nr:hypothetical protein [Parafilimonas sp.]